MLNEEKIRLMTGISMFEKKMMKESIPANRYFKSDYVGSHLIRSFIAYSLTVCLCLLLWVLYRFDDLINAMAVDDLISLGVRLVFYYAAGLLAYLVVTWKIYSRRYDEAAGRSIRQNCGVLKKNMTSSLQRKTGRKRVSDRTFSIQGKTETILWKV